MAHLIEPETSGRRVEQPEQHQMIVLGRRAGQLDHWCSLLKYLPASIQHDVVMRSHLTPCNRKIGSLAVDCDLVPLVPRPTLPEGR